MNTRRGAFTLVEVLTVIVIISILAALVTVAVAGAMRAGQRARIAVQMNHIAMALESYKNEIGEYPPDMFDDDALVRHVRKRWPRYAAENAQSIREAISSAYRSTAYGKDTDFTSGNSLSPLGSLALWLGGFPNADGKLSGFNADPENPFFNGVLPNDRAFDKKAFLDWEVGNDKNVRFCDNGSGQFVPVIGNEVRGTFVPFVYFRGRADGGDGAYRRGGGTIKQFDFSELGWCVPYAEESGSGTNVKWNNPTTYQLIHPGLDGKFGEAEWIDARPETRRIINTGTGIGLQDLDNLTNVSGYKELKSILP